MEMEGWLPCLDNIDKLQQFLGLSDKKPIPDPIRFEKPDPLGAKQVTSQKEEDLASTLSKYSFCGRMILLQSNEIRMYPHLVSYRVQLFKTMPAYSISLVIRHSFFLPKQFQRSRSIISDRSRSLRLFWKGKAHIVAKFDGID